MTADHFNRRDLLLGGGIALAGATALRGQGAVPVPATPAVDVHHHYLPPDYKPLAKPWLDKYATGVAGVIAWTPERSLAAMAAANVRHAVLSLSAPGTFFGAADQARAVARSCNDFAASLVREHGSFSFFAALPMPDVEGAIREAERALAMPGCRGVGLMTNYDGRYLGDGAYKPLFDWLGQRGTLVYVHPTTAACCTGLTPDVPAPLIEFPVDTARTITSLLWSGTFSANPRLRFIFSHGGGVLPMVLERISGIGFGRPELARRVPEGARDALARLYVDTASVTTAPAMAALQQWLPLSHILYGTDFPWGDPARARGELARLGLPPERLAAIESGNAAALGLA